MISHTWKAYWTPAFTSSITLRNSGWRWPMTGSAVALRTRSAALDGPGPIMVFCGTLIGDASDLGGGIDTEDIAMMMMGFMGSAEGKAMRIEQNKVNDSALHCT